MSNLTRVALLSMLLLVSLPALAGAVPQRTITAGGLVENDVTFDPPPLARAERTADLRAPAALSDMRRLSSTQHVLAARLQTEIPGMEIDRRYSIVVDGFA